MSVLRKLAALPAVAVILAAGCGDASKSTAPSTTSQARERITELSSSMDRFSEALASARPARKSSMIALQASADRASAAVRRAISDLRVLDDDASSAERSRVEEMIDGLADVRELTDVLSVGHVAADDLELAGRRAEQAIDDAGIDMPRLSTDPLVTAMRKAKKAKKKTPALVTSSGTSVPVGTAGSASSGGAQHYFTYYGPAFQAKLPDGPDWGSPAQSQPTPGRLYRTSVRGPDGLFVIIDFTPYEPATFGGHYSSRTQVGQTAFGSATRYVFQGGSLPECQRGTCVDYIINDAASGSGFGVLAGGGTAAAATSLAQTVAESVVPTEGD